MPPAREALRLECLAPLLLKFVPATENIESNGHLFEVQTTVASAVHFCRQAIQWLASLSDSD